jgi:hypothetical protein
MINKNATDSWDNFLNPQVLKQNLITSSILLTAYEMLKDSLIGRLRGFYSLSIDDKGKWEICGEYREKVLSLDKNEMVACEKWFRKNGALDDDDLLSLKKLTNMRNMVAHELPSMIGSTNEGLLFHLQLIFALTSKVDKWWIKEIEIPTNPDKGNFTAEELAASFSMRMLIVSLLIKVAEGDDSELTSMYKTWKKLTRPEQGNP